VTEENVTQKHKKFVEKQGKTYAGISKTKKKHRTPNCYSCHQKLDNESDNECNACGWIICGGCGVCGCGYESNFSNNKTRITSNRGTRDENGIRTP
jgi:hypothetical protein